MHGTVIVASIAGMGWFALAMDMHWKQARGDAARGWAAPVVLRALGVAALAASLVLCFAADRPSMAALVWPLSLTLGALTVGFTLAWRPRWLAALAPGGSRARRH